MAVQVNNGVEIELTQYLNATGWFMHSGSYVMVDGQFGSTGKGLLASVLAPAAVGRVTVVTTNQGPNSGHTSYYGDTKVVLKQLPTLPIALLRTYNINVKTVLNAGAIINFTTLRREIDSNYAINGSVRDVNYSQRLQRLCISNQAAVVSARDIATDGSTVKRIASTGSGMGPVLARKINRDVGAVVSGSILCTGGPRYLHTIDWYENDVIFVEVAQGFSLGLNGEFYPYVTSRECTVMQGLADAQLPAQRLRKVVMSVRTFPIRVGSTHGDNSGPCYPDQHETSFEELGVEPEYTTVTKRKRRIFTWSTEQFEAALRANRPDMLFINFMNYLVSDTERERFINRRNAEYYGVMGHLPETILLGYGPKAADVKLYRGGV